MQLISKKIIAFAILLLNFSISFGCFREGQQIIDNDGLLSLGVNGDGALKNSLQKVNQFLNKQLSITNVDFLLRLDNTCLTTCDIQKILFAALWGDGKHGKAIIDRYKIFYNQQEYVSLDNSFDKNKVITVTTTLDKKLSLFGYLITSDKMNQLKRMSLNDMDLKEIHARILEQFIRNGFVL